MSLALFDPLDAEKKQTISAVAVELQERLPWLWAPGFAIGRVEGYKPGFFGARAGPYENVNAYNVLHEVSHAIELVGSEPLMWKRRLGQPDFGMRVKSYQTIGGERYYEPITMQATQRECRVGAIQLHLLQAGGYSHENFETHFVEVLKYMADSYFGGDSILNAHEPEKYTPGQKKWVNTRTNIFDQHYNTHTPESIQRIWVNVAKHLAKKDFNSEPGLAVIKPESCTTSFVM